MNKQLLNINAVGAIRVSSEKQGRDGDSPEDQKQQINRFAQMRGITVRRHFEFLESGSKAKQPMQVAVDYCKDPKNEIKFLIIKSIDRFTRGGSRMYEDLKAQLDECGVTLVDTYGIISDQRVNTLDHLGFKYRWSEYSPSKKSEILEAERAKDELRDIMTRMVGAEIRYTQMGYWMRRPPYGFISEKVETPHGKRCILKPHPTEGKFVKMMYEMRAKRLSDSEIIAKVNSLGCRTRVQYQRDKNDRTKIIRKLGGDPMTAKAMQKYLMNPIYAGINAEKWTGGKPIRCVFDGLVSIEMFNKANKGKRVISINQDDEVSVDTARPKEHLIDKGRRNADFPYRKFILCPTCSNPLSGSASRGKSGKYYPAYHCSNHGHYYRIPKAELESNVVEFISRVTVSSERIDAVMDAVAAEWNLRNQSQLEEIEGIDTRIGELRKDAIATMDKIRVLNSTTAIKFMEEDLMRIESQIQELEDEKVRKLEARPADISRILERVRYFLEHLDELLIKQIDPIKKARLFALLFDQTPTYENIKIGTLKTPLFTGVNPVFALLNAENSLMVTPRGFEPRLPG